MNAPGRKFLKVTGILYIIFSGIVIIALLAVMDGNSNMAYRMGLQSGFSVFYQLIWAIVCLYIGIMGVKYCATPEKAKFLATLAIIDIVWTGIDCLGVSHSFTGFAGLALPILYLIGASKNKKAFEANAAANADH